MGLRPFVLIVGLAGVFAAWLMAGPEPLPVAEPVPRAEPSSVAVGESPLLGIELTVGDALPRKIKGVRDADPGDRKIDAALDRIVTLRCQDVQLADLVKELERAVAIPIRLPPAYIDDKQVDPGMRVSIEVFEVPLAAALDELKSQDISYFVEKGKLVLFIDEVGCANKRETRLYSIALLKTLRADEIMETVTSETSGSWDADEPGTGTISVLGDALVVSQNLRNHREVEGVLNLLLEAQIQPLPPERQARPKPAPVRTGFSGMGRE